MAILLVAEVAILGLWFASAAVLPEMASDAGLSPGRQALLSSAVQAGFVLGALAVALTGLADRADPRRVIAGSALAAAGANALLLVVPLDTVPAAALRLVTGACMAGVYPVGLKIAVGWGFRDRGLLAGLLVGAVTVGSALPHLAAWLGGADWRITIGITSLVAVAGGVAVLPIGLGPHHARALSFDPRAMAAAWTLRPVRLAILGYLGHMWELYGMWAWIGVAVTVSFAAEMPPEEARRLGKLTAFLAIALGGLACVPAGALADRIGRAKVAALAMAASGCAALATAASFGGPPWITVVACLAWGLAIVPDSAQFSALVADAAPDELAGSLITLQTALGFALTIATVHASPLVAAAFGWPVLLALLAIGPALGILAMVRLIGDPATS
jgi:MFS family permease